MATDTFLRGYVGWNDAALGIITMILMTAIVKFIGFVKTYKFYHNFPGSADRSYLLGHIPKVLGDGESFIEFGLKRLKEGNGRFECLWLNPLQPAIFVYHPDLVRKILMLRALKSRNLSSPYSLLRPWIGEGLVASNGERWTRSRKLITPAFHFAILKDYLYIYNEAAERLFKKMDLLAESGESFDICPLLTLCTLEVILKCALSYEPDIQGKGHPYAEAVKELSEGLFERSRKPWLWPDWLFRLTPQGKKFYKNCEYVHTLAEDLIKERKRQLASGSPMREKHIDFIDILLSARDEDEAPMTTDEIRNEVDTFLLAGHDTTASSISWVVYMLAKHPEYQDRVYEEVQEVLEGREKPNILWHDLSRFEMLTQCNRETMRLYPPVPFFQRELTDDVDFDGKIIPAGTIVTVPIVYLHRNPEVWDEPNEFCPERFQFDCKSPTDNYSFIPFSAGPRYAVRLAPDAKAPQRIPAVVLRSESGIWLTIERR